MYSNNKWKYGPSYTTTFQGGYLFEDPSGGVVGISGYNGAANTPAMYYLKNASPFTKWQLLPPTVKTPCQYAVYIPIPMDYANCIG